MYPDSVRQYIAIDLKSFYASVECVERGLDPLDTNLVVADAVRTDKTICLAVSPTLKKHVGSGRPRLFEVVRKVYDANDSRRRRIPSRRFAGKSFSDKVLASHPDRQIDFIVAKPRMRLYMEYSTRIYNIYLRYVAPEDMHVYSIDEVFIDATAYLGTYRLSAHELAVVMIREVLRETGITATAGIGTNLYLCKVAMDIEAKKMTPDDDGVRIAELDERSYREKLWSHRPLTDFWRVGLGTERRLAAYGIYTMGDIARCSVGSEHLLYSLFGVNAELLIDHAWGYEPVTMDKIKAYRPEKHSLCVGQVLPSSYTFRQALTVAREMVEGLSFDLLAKRLATQRIVLDVGYDPQSLDNVDIRRTYHGKTSLDHYGRKVPAHTHGTSVLKMPTSSTRMLSAAVDELFKRCVHDKLLVRRLNVTAADVMTEKMAERKSRRPIQLSLFIDYEAEDCRKKKEEEILKKERTLQETLLEIKRSYGKNAVLRGLNYADGATARERNRQIGGHHE